MYLKISNLSIQINISDSGGTLFYLNIYVMFGSHLILLVIFYRFLSQWQSPTDSSCRVQEQRRKRQNNLFTQYWKLWSNPVVHEGRTAASPGIHDWKQCIHWGGVAVKIDGNANKDQTCTLTTETLNSSTVDFCAARWHSVTHHCVSVQKPHHTFFSSSV